MTARALECDDNDVAEQAMSQLRTLRDRLSELGRTRAASGRVARRSAAWRRRSLRLSARPRTPGRLDLLGGELPLAHARGDGHRPGVSAVSSSPMCTNWPTRSGPRRPALAIGPPASRQPTEHSRSPAGSPQDSAVRGGGHRRPRRPAHCRQRPHGLRRRRRRGRPTRRCGKAPVNSAFPAPPSSSRAPFGLARSGG